MRCVLIAGLAGALSASACTSVDSSNIATSGISANLSITANGTGETIAQAVLMDGANYIKLSSGDSLSVTASGVTGPTALAGTTDLLQSDDL